jgi:aminoglycoside phosphotransferase (APT) family kinase protein
VSALDLDRLLQRADRGAAEWSAGCHATALELVAGGYSSLTYSGRLEGHPEGLESLVLKVAPPGLRPVGNRDVLRQARVLEALAGTPGLPVPTVYFGVEGSEAEDPPFFAMEEIPGQSWEPFLDAAADAPSQDALDRRAIEATKMLAALHAVGPEDVELDELESATPAGELEKWERALATLSDDLAPGWKGCSESLRAAIPDPLEPTLLHGDFRLGNTIAVEGDIRAVIDWEIAAWGDPRIDVAWYLGNCEARPERRLMGNEEVDGRPEPPSGETLLAAYEQAAGRSLEAIPWFVALTSFRAAATVGLIVKHNRKREDPDPAREAFASVPPRLIAMARAQLADRG